MTGTLPSAHAPACVPVPIAGPRRRAHAPVPCAGPSAADLHACPARWPLPRASTTEPRSAVVAPGHLRGRNGAQGRSGRWSPAAVSLICGLLRRSAGGARRVRSLLASPSAAIPLLTRSNHYTTNSNQSLRPRGAAGECCRAVLPGRVAAPPRAAAASSAADRHRDLRRSAGREADTIPHRDPVTSIEFAEGHYLDPRPADSVDHFPEE